MQGGRTHNRSRGKKAEFRTGRLRTSPTGGRRRLGDLRATVIEPQGRKAAKKIKPPL